MAEEKKQELKRSLEEQCLKCQEEFRSANKYGGLFPYVRCKRCNTGRQLHELDDPGWTHDYVKQDH